MPASTPTTPAAGASPLEPLQVSPSLTSTGPDSVNSAKALRRRPPKKARPEEESQETIDTADAAADAASSGSVAAEDFGDKPWETQPPPGAGFPAVVTAPLGGLGPLATIVGALGAAGAAGAAGLAIFSPPSVPLPGNPVSDTVIKKVLEIFAAAGRAGENDLIVTAYNKFGLEMGHAKFDETGKCELTLYGFTSGEPILLRVTNSSGDVVQSDYIDEATGAETNLSTALRALLVLDGSATQVVSITPLTELAARLAGAGDTTPPGVDTITKTHNALAALLNIEKFVTQVIAVNDPDFDASGDTAHAIVLALFSLIEKLHPDYTLDRILTLFDDALAYDAQGKLAFTGANGMEALGLFREVYFYAQNSADKGSAIEGFAPVLKSAINPLLPMAIVQVSEDGTRDIKPNGYLKDNTPSLGVILPISAKQGETIILYDNDKELGRRILTENDIAAGKISFDITTVLQENAIKILDDGEHKFSVGYNDGSKIILSPTYTVTVDTGIPIAPTLADIEGNGTVDYTEATGGALHGTGEVGATVKLTLTRPNIGNDKGFTYTTTVRSDGTWSIPLKEEDAITLDGRTKVTIVQTDRAGNISAPDEKFVNFDTTATGSIAVAVNGSFSSDAPKQYRNNGKYGLVPAYSEGDVIRYEVSTNGGQSWQVVSNATTEITHGEGTYLYRMWLKDANGNINPTQTCTVVVDTSISAPTLDSALTLNASQVGKDFDFSGTGEIGTTVSLKIKDKTFTATVDDKGLWKIPLTAAQMSELDLKHNDKPDITISQTDLAGNVSTQVTKTFAVDTVAPAQTKLTLSNRDGVADTTFTLVLTDKEADTNVAYEYSTDNGATWKSLTVAANGNVDLKGMTDGTYKIHALVRDAAGNTTASNVETITLDAVPPSIKSINTSWGSLLDAAEVNRTGKVTVNTDNIADNQKIYVTLGGKQYEATVISNKAEIIDELTSRLLHELAETKTGIITASYTDADGKVITRTTNYTSDFTKNVADASRLTMDFKPTSINASGDDSGLTFSGNSAHLPAGAKITVTLQVDVANGKSVAHDFVIDSEGAWTAAFTADELKGLGDGRIIVKASAKDASNTELTSYDSFNYDATLPVAGALTLDEFDDTGNSADRITQDKSFTLKHSGQEAGTTVVLEYLKDAGETWNNTEPVQTNLADGTYRYRAVVTDAAGNTSTVETQAITIDNFKPVGLEFTDDPLINATEAEGEFVLHGKGEAKATVHVLVKEKILDTTVADDGTWSLTLTTTQLGVLKHGDTIDIQISQTDRAGNNSDVENQVISVDVQPPSSDISISPAPLNAYEFEMGWYIHGNAEPDAWVTLELSDQYTTQIKVASDGNWNVIVKHEDLSWVSDGSLVVKATQSDQAGNVGSSITNTISVDITRPEKPAVDFFAEDNIINAAEAENGFVISGTGLAGNRVFLEVIDDGKVVSWGSSVVDTAGHWSHELKNFDFQTGHKYSWVFAQAEASGNWSFPLEVPITIDTQAPDVTVSTANYAAETDTLTLVGTHFASLLAATDTAGVDIKAQLDWSKLSYAIDYSADKKHDFNLTDISKAIVSEDGNSLTITLSQSAATALELTPGFNDNLIDTLTVQAGFSHDRAGNVSSTDTTPSLELHYLIANAAAAAAHPVL